MKRVVVTGGAGFIGSHLVHLLISQNYKVLNIDGLKYASSLEGLTNFSPDQYSFAEIDLGQIDALEEALVTFNPNVIFHLAAESHVDRSITSPDPFIYSNIVGTYNLLEIIKHKLPNLEKFVHISTDEVYGSLEINDGKYFSENSPYHPSSPYSATKAAADHLVQAWHITYGLPCIITNGSNNFGPRQYPEKLIPVVIASAISGQKIPIYGAGDNERDWLYVGDHCNALLEVMQKGSIGETYLIGARNVRSNNELVKQICSILDDLKPNPYGLNSYSDLISYVEDRAGHDKRYAIDPSKIESTINWKPKFAFDKALENTVKWYLDNDSWLTQI